MGKYLRHFIAAIVGPVVAALVAWATGIGFEIDADTVTAIEAALSGLLFSLAFMLYAWVEKFLKRFPTLDPEGAADRLAINEEAHARFPEKM